MAEQPKAPRLDSDGPYPERVWRIAQMMDLRNAFVSAGAIADAQRTVARVGAGELPEADPSVAPARRVVDACVHPDTGEVVFTPLRLSFIIPANLMLDLGMILAASPAAVVAAQWANQTYNALHYYANRNASNEDTTETRVQAYVGATASSVGAALWIGRRAARASSRWAPVLRRVAPFGAVAAADVLNLALMRQSEFRLGVHVFDAETGECLGRSRRAGGLAVASCIAGRVFAAAPVLLLSPLVAARVAARRPALRVPALMGALACAIQLAVPVTFGLFKQTADVSAGWLEPEFAARGGRVVYNKGL